MRRYSLLKYAASFLVAYSTLLSSSYGDFLCAGHLNPTVTSEISDRASKPTQRLTEGNRNALVLFARFHGESTGGDLAPSWSREIFDPQKLGSFSHFYDTMSSGKLQVRGEIAPRYYESLYPASVYLADEPGDAGNYGQFVLEILEQADRAIDFTRYDSDGPDGIPNSGDDDGRVDALFLVLPSTPESFLLNAATGIGCLGLEQPWDTDEIGASGDPIQVSSLQGSIQQGRTFTEAVGSMCHEYGHILGLPDLYNTDYLSRQDAPPEEDSAGIGAWGLMGWGTLGWNGNDGPNSFCAWSRMQLGWATVHEIAQSHETLHLSKVDTDGDVFKIPMDTEEYFLLEYRRRENSYYNRHVPGEGLLIWHVDNDIPDLECADGRWLEGGFPVGKSPSLTGGDNLDFWAHDVAYSTLHAGNLGDATDPFDGEIYDAFTHETNPAAYNTLGRRSIRIENIDLNGDVVTAQIQTEPVAVELVTPHYTDDTKDGLLTASEEAVVLFHVVNRGGSIARDVRVSLSTEEPLLEVLQGEAFLGDISVGHSSGQPIDGGGFPRIRLRSHLSNNQALDLKLEVFTNGVSVGADQLQVRAAYSFSLAGKIVDVEGNGLPDIRIRLQRVDNRHALTVVTDGEGGFFSDLTPGAYTYSTQAPGGDYAERFGSLNVGGDTRLDLTLLKAFPVSGTVTGPDGAPLMTAKVAAFWRTGHAFASTSSSGEYTLKVPRGRVFISAELLSSDPSRSLPSQLVEEIEVDAPLHLDLELTRGVVATVHLIAANRSRFNGIDIWPRRALPVPTSMPTTRNSVARLSLLPGVYRLQTLISGSLFVQTEIPLVAIHSDTTLGIRLQHTYIRRGILRDLGRRPFFDAQFLFNALNTGGQFAAVLGSDGSYKANLPQGRFQVAFVPDGLGSTPAQIVGNIEVPGTGIRGYFETASGEPFTGRLVDAEGNVGIAPTHLIAVSTPLAVSSSAQLSEDGQFELYLKPGRYRFAAARIPSSFWHLGEREVVAGESRDFSLPGRAVWDGVLVDPLGQAVNDAVVVLTQDPFVLTDMSSVQTTAPRFFYDGTGFVAATLSDDRGHFELTVDHGDYFALILPARGRELGMVHPIDIAERQETTVVLPFYKSFHEIYGQIKTEADIPRGDATLLFYCETTGAVMQSRTANSGSYHLRLPAGTYQAKVGLLSPVHGFYRVYDLDSVHLDRDRRFDIELGTTSIEDTEEVQEADVRPQWTELEQNYPNPFNPTTTIRYQIEESAQVELKVYDILGRAVATLVSARQPSGMHRARWHGRDVTGHPVASGVYLYRLTVENGTRLFTDTKKLLLVR